MPACRAGQGTGHLRRCLRLAERLGPGARLLLEAPAAPAAMAARFGADPRRWLSAPEGPYRFVLLDRRSTTREELARYRSLGLVVGLDEGGPARRFVPYLVDTLPRLRGGGPANASSFGFLDLPDRERGEMVHPFREVLVSFGGEDPRGLSGRLLDALLRQRIFPPERLTVVAGPLFRRRDWPAGVRRLDAPADLREHLGRYDLVFTSFGLTLFEALAAGVPVICLNPEPYHRRLCRAAGVPEVGVRRPRMRRLKGLLEDRRALEDALERFHAERRGGERLERHLGGLIPAVDPRCPACGSRDNPAAARRPGRTWFLCRSCGLAWQLSLEPARGYGASYFFEEYRAQYGRTYLEDFEAIRRAGLRRLALIDGLHSPSRAPGGARRLLDVGCAFGPFLQAAAERGWEPCGLDVSAEAVEHVRASLGLRAARLDFEGEERWPAELPDGPFDAITMWYVVEHFRDLGRVLRRVGGLLRPGGVFAFATPNLSGISGRRGREAFLADGPGDHYTAWSPGAARRVLRRYGFRVERVRVTGHHPERFPGGAGGPLRRAVLAGVSRAGGLGDTFEVYARKAREEAG